MSQYLMHLQLEASFREALLHSSSLLALSTVLCFIESQLLLQTGYLTGEPVQVQILQERDPLHKLQG